MASTALAALSAVESISLKDKTTNSVTLEWSKVEGASKYIVHYGSSSVQSSGALSKSYQMESDPVSSTGTTISNLSGATYYFAVTPLSASGEEGEILSKELMVSLSSGATVTNATPTEFAFTNVTVKDDRNLVLSFSSPLDTSHSTTVRIKKTTNNANIAVVSASVSKQDATKLEVKLAEAISDATSYQATILSIKGAKGEILSEGSKSIRDFTTPPNVADSAETIALGAPTTPSVALTGALTVMSGANASGSSMSGALNSAPSLPQTGTKETLLLLIAVVTGLAIVSGAHLRKAKQK